MDINEKVLSTLKESDTPLKTSELAEKLGTEKKDIDKAIKKLKSENLIESPKRYYYAAVTTKEEPDLKKLVLKVLEDSEEPLKTAEICDKTGAKRKK